MLVCVDDNNEWFYLRFKSILHKVLKDGIFRLSFYQGGLISRLLLSELIILVRFPVSH